MKTNLIELLKAIEKTETPKVQAETKPSDESAQSEKNPLAALEKSFDKKITSKKDKNGNTIYYINGKRTNKEEAQSVETSQLKQKAEFIFNDAIKAVNAVPKTDDRIELIMRLDNEVVSSENKFSKGFEKVEDAIKCAYYIHQKYSETLDKIMGIIVCKDNKWIFTINADEIRVDSDEAKKIADEIVPEYKNYAIKFDAEDKIHDAVSNFKNGKISFEEAERQIKALCEDALNSNFVTEDKFGNSLEKKCSAHKR